jgi:mycofactocin precursor
VTDIATRTESPAVPEPRTVGSPPMTAPDDAEMVEEVLVEEVSIDGMCGVY